MRNLSTELNRALFSRGFLAAAAGMAAVLFIGAFENLQLLFKTYSGIEYGAHASAMLTALRSDTALKTLPVLAALPCTAGFVEDWKSGYLKHCLPRSGQSGYITGKVGSAGIAGALAILLGVAATYVVFLILYLPAEKPAAQDYISLFPDVLGQAMLFALCGALWSVTGLACSAATLSTHMAYAAPFVLCYVLVILSARYFPGLAVLSPEEWLKPGHRWPGGGWGVALLVLELIAVAALGFRAAAVRRLRHE